MSYDGSGDGDNSSSGSYGGDSSSNCDGGNASSNGDGSGGYGGADSSGGYGSGDDSGGIVGSGTDDSGAGENSYSATNGAVPDNFSSPTENSDSNNCSGLGVQGGEPCTLESEGLSNYSALGNNQESYNYDAEAQSYEDTLDKIQSNWNNTTGWVSENVTQPIQEAYNNYVGRPIDNAVSTIVDTYNGSVEPALDNMKDAISSTYDNYVTQPLNNTVVTPASSADVAEALGQYNLDNTQPSDLLTESDTLDALQQGTVTWSELDENSVIDETSIGEKYANTIKDMEQISQTWSQLEQQDRENLAKSVEQRSQIYDKFSPDSNYYLSTGDPRIPRSAYPDQVAEQEKELRDADIQVLNAAGQYIKDTTQVPLTAAVVSRIPVVSQIAAAVVAPMYAYDVVKSFKKNYEESQNVVVATGITAYNATLEPAMKKIDEIVSGEYATKLNERPISTAWDTIMAVEGARITEKVISKGVETVNNKIEIKADIPKLDITQGPDVAIAGVGMLRDAETNISGENSSFRKNSSIEENPANETVKAAMDETGVLTKDVEQSDAKPKKGFEESTKKDDNVNTSTNGLYENDVLDGASEAGFKYEHNPSDNPKVLKDAVEDQEAVYGYRPSKTGSLKDFADRGWSDPDVVRDAQERRIDYHEKNEAALQSMRDQGLTDGQIAKQMVDKRNQSRLNDYLDENGNITDQEGYNQALQHSKSYEQLKSESKTDQDIIKSSTKGNPGMDACTGLYDRYFDTY